MLQFFARPLVSRYKSKTRNYETKTRQNEPKAVKHTIIFKFKNGPFSRKAKKKEKIMSWKTEKFHHRLFSTPV